MKIYLLKPQLILISILGFVAGIPFMLTGSTLQAWATQLNLNLLTIGALTIIGFPYTIKFLWAPVFDRYSPPIFKGQRRGWLIWMQLLFAVLLIAMSIVPLPSHLYLLIVAAVLVTAFSASFDIVFDAYRLQILPHAGYAMGNACYASAYRISILVSGGLALVLADLVGWQWVYRLMACLVFISLFATYQAPEPAIIIKIKHPEKTLWHKIATPWQSLWQIKQIGLIVIFIILYKFGEALGTSLNTAFLIRHLGFSLTIIGGTYKITGMIATIIGSFVGGALYIRTGLFRALWWFGWLQALALLPYATLAVTGKNLPLLISAVAAEAFTAGMATTAFISLLMELCQKEYAVSQMALLTAIAPIARIFSGPLAGWLAEHYGWYNYFVASFVTCIPALLLLFLLRRHQIFNLHHLGKSN